MPEVWPVGRIPWRSCGTCQEVPGPKATRYQVMGKDLNTVLYTLTLLALGMFIGWCLVIMFLTLTGA